MTNVAILFYLGLNFRIFFLNFFAKCPRLTNTVNVVKRLFRFIQANYQTFYSMKKMLQQLFLVQLPQKILIFRPETLRHSPAVEFNLKKISYIHSLNKTKQPFYNLLQCFRVQDNLRKNSKKKFENLTLEKTKQLHYTAKKIIKISQVEQVLLKF